MGFTAQDGYFEVGRPPVVQVMEQERPVRHDRKGVRVRDFRLAVVQSESDRTAVNRLVARMYQTRGYRTADAPIDVCERAATFMALDGQQVIGTMTARDGADGPLLAEELFAEEVAGFRATGMGVCEFTKLAMDRRARSPRLLASLFHVAYVQAYRIMGLRHLLIEVNPRHVRYYETMLGFTVVCAARHNSRVDAPAVLLVLDMCHAQRMIELFGGSPVLAIAERSAYPYFFGDDVEREVTARLRYGESDLTKVQDAASDEVRLPTFGGEAPPRARGAGTQRAAQLA